MKKTAPVVAAIAALAFAPSAFAKTIHVEFDKELLKSSDGREAIYELFVEEAYDTCRSELRDTRTMPAVSVCTQQYVDSLVQDLGDAEIEAMNQKGWRHAI